MTQSKYLDEVRQREQAATTGPWDACLQDSDSGHKWFDIWASHSIAHVSEDARPDEGLRTFRHDANFIAHARTDIPKLLDLIESLEREVSVLREGLGMYTEITLYDKRKCHWFHRAIEALSEADKIRESREK